jgi:hypothetical protein
LKGNFEEPVAVLFASFKKWAELMSEPPLSSKAFSSKPFYAFDFVPVPFCSFRDSRSVRSVRAAKSIQKGETTAKTHRSGHRITSRGLPPQGWVPQFLMRPKPIGFHGVPSRCCLGKFFNQLVVFPVVESHTRYAQACRADTNRRSLPPTLVLDRTGIAAVDCFLHPHPALAGV